MGNSSSSAEDGMNVKMNQKQYREYINYMRNKEKMKKINKPPLYKSNSRTREPKRVRKNPIRQVPNRRVSNQQLSNNQVLNKQPLNQQNNLHQIDEKIARNNNANNLIFANPGLQKQFMPIVGENTSNRCQNTPENHNKYQYEVNNREYNKNITADTYLPRMRSQMTERDSSATFEEKLVNLNNSRDYSQQYNSHNNNYTNKKPSRNNNTQYQFKESQAQSNYHTQSYKHNSDHRQNASYSQNQRNYRQDNKKFREKLYYTENT